MKDLVHILKNLRQHLMNGVSYMIPVVVSGGILFAVATMLSIGSVTSSGSVQGGGVVGVLSQIGGVGLGMMVPVLSAYIAASIADRPGIAPGLISGQLAVNVGAGFIGGVISGLLSGIIAEYLKKIPLPKSMRSLKSILIIPIGTSLVVGTIMICIIGTPCAWLLDNMTTWLTNMNGSGAILVGAITGAMIAFDLGGPINKVAFSTGAALVGTMVVAGENCTFMGPVALAIGLPPIAVGIATFLFRKKFSQEERDAGVGAIAMGLCGISEGAISYTTADPVHMIPINVVSCAVGGAVAGGLQVHCNAAWGGVVILPVTSALTYLFSLAVGIAVYLVLIAVFKKDYHKPETEEDLPLDDLDISLEL